MQDQKFFNHFHLVQPKSKNRKSALVSFIVIALGLVDLHPLALGFGSLPYSSHSICLPPHTNPSNSSSYTFLLTMKSGRKLSLYMMDQILQTLAPK